MHISLIINAEPGAVVALRKMVGQLREAGHQVSPHLTFEAGDACRLARQAAEQGADLVLVAGGDGTLNEVANGLHHFLLSCSAGLRAPRLGILPLGTANDFAGALGIPALLERALQVALSGQVLEVDVGVMNERCFLNVSSGGMGAEATEETSDEMKQALGTLAYAISGVRKLATGESSRARFEVEGKVLYQGPFLLFAVGNSWRTGGGNRLTPQAEVTDRKLDLCIVAEMSRLDFVRLLPDLRRGSHVEHPGILYAQVPRIRVEAEEEELSVNLDGEPLHSRCLEYRVSPHRLPVMVPSVAPPGGKA